jgi:hypothetical protein
VYRVSGITTGLRAEWSTYVDDGSGNPRFMIVRARAAEGSVDPIGPLAGPEPFQHELDAGVIRTAMKRTTPTPTGPVLTADDLFTSTITLPAAEDRNYQVPNREWVAANDYIYWLNGVNDRTFHNATAHSAQLISVDLADVTLADDTEWVPFIEPVPAHVLVYLGPIQFMIGPWWNITSDGRVDATTRNNLFALKGRCTAGSRRSARSTCCRAPRSRSCSRTSRPPTRRCWHWQIPAEQLTDFAAAADLPPGMTLSPVQLGEGRGGALAEPARVPQSGDVRACAEWSTYVDDGRRAGDHPGGTRRPPGARPVNRFTLPYP